MESILEAIAQYGPLAIWTASLLWMNWQQRKENKENERRAAAALKFHQEQILGNLREQQEEILENLREQKQLLEKTMDKVDHGLLTMKEKHAEERAVMMRNNPRMRKKQQ